MQSRDRRSPLYSTDLLAYANDEELFRKIAEIKAAEAERQRNPDDLDLDFDNLDMSAVETDEEILAAIDDFCPDDDGVVEIDPATHDRSNEVTVERSSKVTAPVAIWSSKVTGRSSKSPSSKVTPRFRKSQRNDMRTIDKIRDFAKSLTVPVPVPLVVILTPSKTPLISPPERTPKSANNNSLPVWEKSGDHLKLTMANEVLETSGAPVTSWTQDLTPTKIKSALSHRSGFTGSLADDLKRALMRELGRESLFWFHVDISKAGHLHLHGASDTGPQDQDGLERALRHIGGHGPKSKKDDHMVDLNPRRCDEGWVIYASQSRGAVRKKLGEKAPLYTISRPLRREAADLYWWIRKVVNAAQS